MVRVSGCGSPYRAALAPDQTPFLLATNRNKKGPARERQPEVVALPLEVRSGRI